ncbi:MAG: hypothetical protein JSS66_14280 [Armatimonadetes bacterium]|nr:hypothetical protein [Armatimonadota bacterium]
MRVLGAFALVALSAVTFAGQPVERFRGADHFSFCQGSTEARYGNSDGLVRVQMEVFILGHQEFTGASASAEQSYTKTAGSLDFSIKLSDLDPSLPPDTIALIGSDLGNDQMKHTTDEVLPGPYHIQGNYNGVDVDLTLTNVHVTGSMFSQGSNNTTLPVVNPVLGQFCDVQFDDVNGGSANTFTAIPAQVSGWVISSLFTVRSMRVDVTGIQQAAQVPARLVAPNGLAVNLGRLNSGSIASLAAIDGDALSVCKFIVPNQSVAPVNVEVSGNAPPASTSLALVTYGHMTVSGTFQQTLDMYDFAGASYATGQTRTDSIGTADSLVRLDATGNISRFFGPSNQVKARYRVKQVGPAASNSWCVNHDMVAWAVTP